MRGELDEAKIYYQRAVDFAREVDADESGYYHYSLLNLGEIAEKQGEEKKARDYYKLVKKEAKRSSRVHERARENIKSLRRS